MTDSKSKDVETVVLEIYIVFFVLTLDGDVVLFEEILSSEFKSVSSCKIR